MARKSGVLELAVLGLLSDSPMHGYELSKQLKGVLGPLRAISYGSLYPCLAGLETAGFITADATASESAVGRRKKHVYKLTAEGKERLQDELAEAGPSTWDDDTFGVRFAFFSQTPAAVRLRILEGRRSRLEERQENANSQVGRTRERLDHYTLELQRHGLESVEREVRWLEELIETERSSTTSISNTSAASSARRTSISPAVVPALPGSSDQGEQ